MAKLICVILAFAALCSFALPHDTGEIAVIGGADGPTAIFLTESEPGTVISFDANATTGYQWFGFVLAGDSVEIDEEASGYVSDPNPEMLDGVGGTHYFKLNALCPGVSVLRFTYGYSAYDEGMTEVVMLACVDEELHIVTEDITESGVLEGTVTEVREEGRTALMDTESSGEVLVLFADGEALPVRDERIAVYIDGTMTASLPPQANALAWRSLASEDARAAEPDGMFMLDGPGSYVEMLTGTVIEVNGKNVVIREDNGDEAEALTAAVNLTNGERLRPGDHVRVSYPGGMGYTGDPMEIETYFGISFADE